MKKHEIYDSNPDLKEVHMTSDGEPFYNANDAKMHAKSLKDKLVEIVVNPLQIEVIAEDTDDEDFDIIDQFQTGTAIDGEMTGFETVADGSVNVLDAGADEAASINNLLDISAESAENLPNSGGETINVAEAPKAEAPKENAKKSK